MHIVNGRFGTDKGIGSTTCADASTIDYMIVSPEIMSRVKNFEVDVFDSAMSDKHNPIIVTLAPHGETIKYTSEFNEVV